MTRRYPSPMAVLSALLALGLGARPAAAPAATINPNAPTATATYRLTSTTNLPAPDAGTQGPQVVATILPPGSVVPPTLADGSQGSPLTILPDSKGFDPSHLVVALKDAKSSSGQPEQMFGLVFFGQGLQPGGVLHFALSIDKALASHPPVLESMTPGVSIVPDPIATNGAGGGAGNGGGSGSGGGNGGGSGSGGGGAGGVPPAENQVPEPVSMVLWSSVALGLAARRRLRPGAGRAR